MLTVKSVEKQLKEVGERNKFDALVAKEGCSRSFSFLQSILPYLRTNPSKDYVAKEVNRLTKERQAITDRFEAWKKSNPGEWEARYYEAEPEQREREMKRIFSEYKAAMGMTAINRQLKALTFILNPESTVVNEVSHGS